MMSAPFDFDDDFASPASWAALYRKLGWQVIPAYMPNTGQWKRPLLTTWTEFQDTLVGQMVFARWYDPLTGDYRRHRNMGTLTGSCSGGLWVLDLDNKPQGPSGRAWWNGLLAVHNNNIEPETPRQQTGGGGEQLFFRAPEGWRPPTFKAPPMAVDVRGQGGFAMLPPSAHASGANYGWAAGAAPWEVEVLEAPEWLIEAVETLRLEHGGQDHRERATSADSSSAKNAFGMDVDGREAKLQAMVWAAITDLYRESPIPPPQGVQEAEIARLWTQYEQTTKSRLSGPEFDSLDNAAKLEREGRGLSELRRKWRYAFRKWDTGVKAAAAQPRPNPGPPPRDPEPEAGPGATAEPGPDMKDPTLFEVLSMADMAATPDMDWLVKQVLPRGGLGLLFAAPGSFKTFVAVDLAMALAYETGAWLGYATKPDAHVLYLASEGAAGLYRRIVAWRRKHEQDGHSARFHVIREPMSFMHAPDMQRLAKTITAHAEAHGRPDLIVVDTVSRVLPGADENLQKDMTVFVGACDRLRQQFGAAVLGVHHTNKAGEMRGSSVLNGAADSVFRVERADGELNGVLVCEKQKDAEDGWRKPFAVAEMMWFPDGKIEPQASLVIDWDVVQEADSRASWPPRAILRAMQWAIHAAFEKGEPLSMAPQTKNTGRYASSRLANQFELRSKVVHEIIQTWLDNGVIEVSVVSSRLKLRGLEVVKWLD